MPTGMPAYDRISKWSGLDINIRGSEPQDVEPKAVRFTSSAAQPATDPDALAVEYKKAALSSEKRGEQPVVVELSSQGTGVIEVPEVKMESETAADPQGSASIPENFPTIEMLSKMKQKEKASYYSYCYGPTFSPFSLRWCAGKL